MIFFLFKIFTRWDLRYKTYNILMTSDTLYYSLFSVMDSNFALSIISHPSSLTCSFFFHINTILPHWFLTHWSVLCCHIAASCLFTSLVSPRVDIKASCSSSPSPCYCCPYMCVCMCVCVWGREKESAYLYSTDQNIYVHWALHS